MNIWDKAVRLGASCLENLRMSYHFKKNKDLVRRLKQNSSAHPDFTFAAQVCVSRKSLLSNALKDADSTKSIN